MARKEKESDKFFVKGYNYSIADDKCTDEIIESKTWFSKSIGCSMVSEVRPIDFSKLSADSAKNLKNFGATHASIIEGKIMNYGSLKRCHSSLNGHIKEHKKDRSKVSWVIKPKK